MSYILEALKKAQAERQIGATPTIHAPTLAVAATGEGNGALRKPLLIAMGLMGVAIVALAGMLWRQPSPVAAPAPLGEASAPKAVPSAAPATMPAEAATPAAAPAPAPVPAPAAAPFAPPPAIPVAAPAATPAIAAVAAPVKNVAAAAVPTPATAPDMTAPPRRTPPVAAVPAPETAPAVVAEEPIQSLRDLPEPIQRAIPAMTLGGYMYSKNPADRLLLIDKVLRHEGEEVAPGLVLERLLPKAAVFSFRGYRYRIAI
jgi:general secretion pathway protein B